MFSQQIGKTMKVYVDDMLIKSKFIGDHVAHLSESKMFKVLKKYQMKLNLLNWEIEANLEKIQALLEMTSPRNPHEE